MENIKDNAAGGTKLEDMSSWVNNEGINADIYDGINKLPNRYCYIKPSDIGTGMNRIYDEVSKYLYGCYTNFMVEYSLVASTLDPEYEGKLQCCSFIKGDENFIKSAESEYNNCIESVFDTYGISLYQHPNFLYNIKKEDWFNSNTTEKGSSARSLFLITVQNGSSSESTEKDRKLMGKVFPLDRKYSDMIELARSEAKKGQEKIKLLDLHKKLHEECHKKISNSEPSSYYISFPVFGSIASNQLDRYKVSDIGQNPPPPHQGIGACFIYFESTESKLLENEDFIKNVSKLVYYIGDVIRYISVNYLFNLGLKLQENATVEAIKSAKAAIMSRNMSHNLGSHVMAYLKQHLSSVTSILNDNVLTQLYDKNVDISKNLEHSTVGNGGDLALPFLVGLGHFVSYLQERQDYIATVSTDYIPYNATVNFKDAIYDELNPDKRYERHQDRLNMKLDNILLGNIARSEGLGRQTSPTLENGGQLCDIVLNYGNFDGNKIPENSADTFDKSRQEDLEDLRNFNVSLPGGIVGRQAVFSIIENIIRNAAKHGNWRSVGKLELTIKKYDIKDDFPENDDYDKGLSLSEEVERFYKPAADIDNLYIITLTDNTTCEKDFDIEDLQKRLNEDYIDRSKRTMNTGNKGLKEMRISAAWLRSIKEEEQCVNPSDFKTYGREECTKRIEDNKLLSPIIHVRIAKDENNKGHLQYIFCLAKPNKIAVITTTDNFPSTEVEGYKFFTTEQFKSENNKSYEFILCDTDETFKELRPLTSSRLYRYSVDSNNLPSLQDLYAKLLVGEQEKDIIFIDDKKAFTNVKESTDFKVNDRSRSYYLNGKEIIRVADGIANFSGKYIYRTHHDTLSEFDKFMKDYDEKNVEFVESITGNNATDRLIRNEKIDKIWYYRHMHAMKLKIGIFDERIFAKIAGLEETDFTRGKARKATKEDLQECITYYTEIFKDNEDFQNDYRFNAYLDAEKFNKYVEDNYKNLLQVEQQFSKNQSVAAYVQKSIYVFSFVPDLTNEYQYFLVGIHLDEDRLPQYEDKDNKKYGCLCKKLAVLSWNKNEKKLDVDFSISKGSFEYKQFFDYISIHQGLLDKLYKAFKIEKEEEQKKKKITEVLYDQFCKNAEQNDINAEQNDKKEQNDKFLPGVIIHSGRSKPSVEDMPQKLPFIQYAALEHAVMDCKYSLVELFDYAHYEQC